MRIEEMIQKYIFHDSLVSNVEVSEDRIVFSFGEPPFIQNNEGDYVQSNVDKILLAVDGLQPGKEYEHISITRFDNNKRKDLTFGDFLLRIRKHSYRIYADYYNKFTQSILIKAFQFGNRDEVEIVISEISGVTIC